MISRSFLGLVIRGFIFQALILEELESAPPPPPPSLGIPPAPGISIKNVRVEEDPKSNPPQTHKPTAEITFNYSNIKATKDSIWDAPKPTLPSKIVEVFKNDFCTLQQESTKSQRASSPQQRKILAPELQNLLIFPIRKIYSIVYKKGAGREKLLDMARTVIDGILNFDQNIIEQIQDSSLFSGLIPSPKAMDSLKNFLKDLNPNMRADLESNQGNISSMIPADVMRQLNEPDQILIEIVKNYDLFVTTLSRLYEITEFKTAPLQLKNEIEEFDMILSYLCKSQEIGKLLVSMAEFVRQINSSIHFHKRNSYPDVILFDSGITRLCSIKSKEGVKPPKRLMEVMLENLEVVNPNIFRVLDALKVMKFDEVIHKDSYEGLQDKLKNLEKLLEGFKANLDTSSSLGMSKYGEFLESHYKMFLISFQRDLEEAKGRFQDVKTHLDSATKFYGDQPAFYNFSNSSERPERQEDVDNKFLTIQKLWKEKKGDLVLGSQYFMKYLQQLINCVMKSRDDMMERLQQEKIIEQKTRKRLLA